MNYKLKYSIFALLVAGALGSCKRAVDIHTGILNTGNYSDTSGLIKTLASNGGMLFGFAAEYNLMTSNPAYAATIAREANIVTFANELKYGSIVQNDGSFNFTTADAFYNLCANAGLQVFGHNLVWYQQQNTVYLNGIVGNAGSSSNPNMLTNGGFETWSNPSAAPNGYNYNNGSTYFSQATPPNVHSGNYAVAVSGYGAASGSGWHVQLALPVPTVVGHTYTISFWAKGTTTGSSSGPGNPNNGGCYYQGEWDNTGNAQYTGDQAITSTGWAQYTMKFNGNSITPAATKTSTVITFDMGTIGTGQTVWLDDVVVNDYTQDSTDAANNSSAGAVAERVDSVLQLWINAAVTRYAGKIKAWDVLNEPLGEDGNIRTSSNTTAGAGEFIWSQYLGKSVGVAAVTYARAADPSALLFINEYNLESNTVKLDSLIAYVNYLKSQGTPVDGIGTQMHSSILSSYAGIDAMFQALAATGLKIRISEMDIKVNPGNKANFSAVLVPATIWGSQASMYNYIVNSYIKYVPAAQRYGITVWGVHDPDSWLYNNGQDFPLLFDSSFTKKPAYSGVLQALKGQ